MTLLIRRHTYGDGFEALPSARRASSRASFKPKRPLDRLFPPDDREVIMPYTTHHALGSPAGDAPSHRRSNLEVEVSEDLPPSVDAVHRHNSEGTIMRL